MFSSSTCVLRPPDHISHNPTRSSKRHSQAKVPPLALSLPVSSIRVHKPLFQGPVLQVPNEIPIIASLTTLTTLTSPLSPITSTTGSSPSVGLSVRWRRVVCRTRLQSDRGIGIQVAHHPLQGSWYTAIVLFQGRCPLSARPCGGLGVKGVRGWSLRLLNPWCRMLRHHADWWLRRISSPSLLLVRWWCSSLVASRSVHVVHVLWRRLCKRTYWICVHLLHRSICSVLSLSLRSGLLLPLLAHGFSALLFLHAWCWRLGRARTHRHWWNEWTCELLLCDERMELGLIWCPSLKRVEMK